MECLNYGRLQVLSESFKNEKGRTFVTCRCECGAVKDFELSNLKTGATQSCGCLHKETVSSLFRKHGYSKNRLYINWKSMKQRCCNPNSKSYPRYGGRGIKVCDRWLESFENFYDDMGDPPSEKHSVDRIDNDGDYCPENCRWATRAEQMMNRSGSIVLFVDGKPNTIKYWVVELGLPMSETTIRRRIKKSGKSSVEKSLNQICEEDIKIEVKYE